MKLTMHLSLELSLGGASFVSEKYITRKEMIQEGDCAKCFYRDDMSFPGAQQPKSSLGRLLFWKFLDHSQTRDTR